MSDSKFWRLAYERQSEYGGLRRLEASLQNEAAWFRLHGTDSRRVGGIYRGIVREMRRRPDYRWLPE